MENAADNDDPITREIFDDLCYACRTGDLYSVQVLAPQININQVDEWDYSPLILASLCGHLDIVKYLLGNGAICDKDTFEGERCVYGALNDNIRNLLLSYDMNTSMDVANPFISHIIKLGRDDLDWAKSDSLITKDVAFDFNEEFNTMKPTELSDHDTDELTQTNTMRLENKVIKAHRFILSTRSPYFSRKFKCDWKYKSIITAHDICANLSPTEFFIEFKYLMNLIYLNFSSNKIDISKLNHEVMFELIDLLELDTSLLELMKLETSNQTFRKKSKLRNNARKKIFDTCKIQFSEKYSNIRNVCLPEASLSNDEKIKLFDKSYFDTIIYYFDEEKNQTYYFPVNKAMLLRATYYEVLFKANFQESVHRKIDNKYKIVEQIDINCDEIKNHEFKKKFCDSIPVIEVNLDSKESAILFLKFLYGYDNLKFPLDAALEMLYFGHYLEFDALKAYSSKVLIGARVNNSRELIEYDLQTLSYLLKASWTTLDEKLKEFVTRSLTMKIVDYYNDPIFIDLVRESASMVKNRHEWDSIELIDEIRYYLENWKYPKHSKLFKDNLALQNELDLLEKSLQEVGLEA